MTTRMHGLSRGVRQLDRRGMLLLWPCSWSPPSCSWSPVRCPRSIPSWNRWSSTSTWSARSRRAPARGAGHRHVRGPGRSRGAGPARARVRRRRLHDAGSRTDDAGHLREAHEHVGRSASGTGPRDVRRLSGRRRAPGRSRLPVGRPVAAYRSRVPGGIDRPRLHGHRDRADPPLGLGAVPGEDAIKTVLLVASAITLLVVGGVHWRRWRLGRNRIELAWSSRAG